MKELLQFFESAAFAIVVAWVATTLGVGVYTAVCKRRNAKTLEDKSGKVPDT